MLRSIAALLLVSAPAAAAERPSLHLEPYAFKLADGSNLAAERGRFEVPEDRRDPRSRRIAIGFMRLKSTSPTPGAPIVYLAGGPGGTGTGTARGPRQPLFLALREVADVIVLDQRGTGWSNAIPPCTADAPFDRAQALTEASLTAYYRATLDACVNTWQRAGVALGGYTTEASADDLEDLRRALGAPRLDLWGISYGTHLALATMRRHPKSIGRAALASVEGLGQTVKLPSAAAASFERIDAALGGVGLPALMRRVHARFATPQPMAADGERFIADAFALQMVAGFVAKNPDGLAQLVQLYRAADRGDTGRFAALVHRLLLARPLTLGGMAEAMDIASGIDPARLAQVDREAPDAPTGRALNFPMPQLRDAIAGLDLGDPFRREIKSRIPVLVLSGDLDVRTPLEEQQAAIAGLKRRHVVRVLNGGHDLYEAHPDMPALLLAFFSGRPVTTRALRLPPPRAD
jgi:pimeloyl-ACP methyl ester carboxylesterase